MLSPVPAGQDHCSGSTSSGAPSPSALPQGQDQLLQSQTGQPRILQESQGSLLGHTKRQLAV